MEFGLPTTTQSTYQPYVASNYSTTQTTQVLPTENIITADYPATNYTTTTPEITTGETYTTTNYETTTDYPVTNYTTTTDYSTTAYETPATTYDYGATQSSYNTNCHKI